MNRRDFTKAIVGVFAFLSGVLPKPVKTVHLVCDDTWCDSDLIMSNARMLPPGSNGRVTRIKNDSGIAMEIDSKWILPPHSEGCFKFHEGGWSFYLIGIEWPPGLITYSEPGHQYDLYSLKKAEA